MIDVLAARGWSVPNEIRSHILACTDPEKLQQWLTRAVTATSLTEAMADD